jgi:hypothetical protein
MFLERKGPGRPLFFIVGIIASGSILSAQTVSYSSLVNGGKLPYGKNVTLTGKLTDLKCGSQAIPDLLSVSSLTVSYLGQTTQPVSATISGNDWSAPLGQLPPDTAINLLLKVTGKLVEVKRSEIASDLIADPQFQRSLEAFFELSRNQPSSVVTDEAERLLREISDQNGALTRILQSKLSCVSINSFGAAAVTALRANLPAFLNISRRLAGVKGRNLDGVTDSMTAAQLHDFIQTNLKNHPENYASRGMPLTGEDLQAAQNAVDLFERDYTTTLSAFAADVIAQVNTGVQLDVPSVTTDLQKYAGFDVGAVYVPRINELRQFFMINVYPFGPVELDTQGLLPRAWKARASIAFGLSLADLSANAHSRVKSDKAFVYGFGYRINKYFRFNVGAVVYRDSGPGNGMLNEWAVGPSIDITALPALKQIFASASGSSDSGSSKP